MTLSRREFVTGSIAAAAGLALKPSLLRARVPVRRENRRVVIIGSGFGGGVSALRLAQAGVGDILVLERGKRWPTGPNAETFPAISNGMKHALYYGTAPVPFPGLNRSLLPEGYAGLLEAHVSPNLLVLNAAGVGGGSIAYQGMTLQPSRAVFEETFPAGLDYDQLDRVYYPRVARMLGVQTVPDQLLNTPTYYQHRVFRDRAKAAGYHVEKIPMPIDWSWALRELKGEMKPSYTNGDCPLGINNGGKHSVDVTYIAQAEATGNVTVAPLHNVVRIGRKGNGLWRIEVDHTDVHGTVLEQKVITTKNLILSAGSVNTTRLLLKAQYEDTIRDLPDAVGHGWGSNGDRILSWTNTVEDFGAVQGGPVVFDSKDWSDPRLANTICQASVPPLGLDSRTAIIVGFGVSEARGHWTYNPATDLVDLHWKHEADSELHKRILERMRNIIGTHGVLGDTYVPAPMTWHPLGGACMQEVADLEGRVYDLPGLYVLDGSLMPGTTAACNPSMSIAAITERAMDKIVKTEVGVTI